MKKISWLLIFIFMAGFSSAAAASDIFLYDDFNGSATNSMPASFTFKGNGNARVVEDGPGNKAFFFPSADSSLLSADLTGTGTQYIVSLRLKFMGKRSGMKLTMKNASASFSPVSASAAGVITTHDGKRIGTTSMGYYTTITIGYNGATKKYFVAVDGKTQVSDWRAGTDVSSPTAILLNFTAPDTEPSLDNQVYLDDFAVYAGKSVRTLAKQAYSAEAVEFQEQPLSTGGDLPFFEKTFEGSGANLSGFMSLERKSNTIELRAEETTGNHYMLVDKTENTDPFFDMDLANAGSYFVTECDLKVDQPGMVTALFRLRDLESNAWSMDVQVNENGSISSARGGQITQLVSGQWTHLALAYNLLNLTYSAYVNHKLVLQDVPMSNQTFGTLAYCRTHSMATATRSDISFDNIRIYNGKTPRAFSNPEPVGEAQPDQMDYSLDSTVYPNDAEDAAKLKGNVALHMYSNQLFVMDHKQTLASPPYLLDGVEMVPVCVAKYAFGKTVDWDPATQTATVDGRLQFRAGNDAMTREGATVQMAAAAELKNDVLYVPLRSLLGDGLKKQLSFYDDGLVVVSDTPFQYASNETVMKALNRYMFFDRQGIEDLKDVFSQSGMSGTHPRILATSGDFARIRSQYRTNAYIKSWMDYHIQKAETICGEAPAVYEIPDGLRLLSTSRKVLDRLSTLGLVYQVTGNRKYAQRAWAEMEAVCAFPDWNPKHFLDIGEMTAAMGIGYDWFYDRLTEDQRVMVENAIIKFGLMEGKNFYEGNPTGTDFTRASMNWNVVCNGGLSVGALAIADRHPGISFFTVACALRGLEYMLPEFAPDGAWEEGLGYWEYTIQYLSYFSEAMRTALGTDFNILNYKGISKTALFALKSNGNTGANRFHDDAGTTVSIPSQLFWLGKRFEDPGVTAAKLVYEKDFGSGASAFTDLLWYDTAVQPDTVNLPLDGTIDKVEVGSMRSSWSDHSGMFVSFHGGTNMVNHSHLDTGTFVMEMLGERWAVDLGSDDYTLDGYFYTNGPRWNYYRARAEGHNTLVINPSADLDQSFQAGKFSPIVKAESKPKGAYQVLDMTQAYSNRPEVLSARRGYMLADNRRSFVLRDEIKVNKQSEIYWFMHTKAQVELLDSHTALLTQNGQTMKFEFLSDTSNAELSVMDAAPLPTSPQPQGQNKNNGYRKLAIRLSGTGSLNISVRMTPYFEKAAQTPFTCSPIDGWTLPDGEIPPMPSAEMIYIDGLPLEGFSPTHGSYRFDVPDQQEELPSVTIQAEGKTIERYETRDGVRFEISDPSEPGQVRIYNVQLHVSPIRDYQKLVPASVKASAVPEPENVPENVADGNLDTRWAAQETQWIELDLGEAQSFDKIALAWMNGNERHYKFKLLVSVDGKSYQPVYEGHSSGGSNDYELYACPGTTARYIRYEGSGSDVSTWNSVTEFWALKSN